MWRECFKKPSNSQHLQEPINCNDEADVIGGQAYRCKHYDHGDQTRLRDSSCSDTGCCGCDTDGEKGQK